MIKITIALIGAALVASSAQASEKENKVLVAHFIHDVFVEKNPDAARKYLSPDYIQHNPHVAPRAEGFITSLRDWFAHAPSDMTDETLHLVAEGDLVVAHQRVTYTAKDGSRKQAVDFDLFRISHGGIVEHWDAEG